MSYADFMRAKHSTFLGGPVPTVAPAPSMMAPPTAMAPANPLANLSPDQMMQGISDGTANYDLIAVSDELSRRRDQTATPNQPVAQPAMVANQVAPLDPIGGTPQPIAPPNQGLGFLGANAPPMDPTAASTPANFAVRPSVDLTGATVPPATPPTMVNVGSNMTAGQNLTVDPNTRYQPTTTMSVSGATPYQEYGLTEAQRLYEQGAPEYYQGQTFVDFSPQTEQALRAQEERALAGSPVMQAAQDLTQKTLSGGFLGSNPYLEGAIQRALDPVQSRISSQLAQRGRAGSGLAAAEMSRALGDVAADVSYRDYASERERQQSALGYAPSMAQADYADISQLCAVGVAREQQAQKAIDDAMARYEYAQEAPFTALGQYSDFLGGFPSGTTSQVYAPYNPPTESQQQLSTAAAIAGMLPEGASTQDKVIAAIIGGLL